MICSAFKMCTIICGRVRAVHTAVKTLRRKPEHWVSKGFLIGYIMGHMRRSCIDVFNLH
jgi:hypothetical protein